MLHEFALDGNQINGNLQIQFHVYGDRSSVTSAR